MGKILIIILGFFLAGCTENNDSLTTLQQNSTLIVSNNTQELINVSILQENATMENTTQNSSDLEILENTTQPVSIQTSEPALINGKTLDQRLQEASDNLHTEGSGAKIVDDFPDVELVYIDNAESTFFPSNILPFKYYYSQEANKTFSICNINYTVFVCDGKLSSLITEEDITSKRCEITPVYLNDPRTDDNDIN